MKGCGKMSQITKKALSNALMELLQERTIEKITVKDITDKCELNRNTFYYHFADVYDLLNYIFLNEADKIIDKNITCDSWQNMFYRLTEYIIEHKKMIMHVYDSLSREHLKEYLVNVAGKLLEQIIRKEASDLNVSDDDILFLSDFYKFALVGILFEWIKNGLKEEPDDYIDKIENVTEGHIRESLLRFEKNVK